MTAVTGTFVAAGASTALFAPSGHLVDISISGGNGTVQIQREVNGVYRVVEEIVATTFSTERVLCNARGRNVRLECTVYNSGTITYSIELGNMG